MDISFKEISVRELVEGYKDLDEDGVFGYSGKLNIRPPYQREFVYKDQQRNAVINTVTKNFPLNVFYWAVNADGTYEIIDGQQRTISICRYVAGDYAFNNKYFHNLQDDEKEQILSYKLMVYFCEGTESEKLEWFKTINIAGEKLTEQELRNAVYSGSWVSDAKRYFSKTGCPAFQIGGSYLKGSPIRQDFLQTVIKWRSDNNIEDYMAQRQHEPTANELWSYFRDVIDWVESTFTTYRSEMKGLQWGELYNKYKNRNYDPEEIEKQVSKLMKDDEVTQRNGIYLYIFTGEEKYLSIRIFNNSQKRKAYEVQDRKCADCGEEFKFNEMEADHVIPWSKGGKTTDDNCQMKCVPCNRSKGNK